MKTESAECTAIKILTNCKIENLEIIIHFRKQAQRVYQNERKDFPTTLSKLLS